MRTTVLVFLQIWQEIPHHSPFGQVQRPVQHERACNYCIVRYLAIYRNQSHLSFAKSSSPRNSARYAHRSNREVSGYIYRRRSIGSQTSISFFFWAALLAPSVRASKSPLISHMPRKIPPSREISSQGASYSMTSPLSRTSTLS